MKRILPALLAFTIAIHQPALGVSLSPAKVHWECVPIARSLSGIQIRGDAHTWWGQADGRYRRGQAPQRGAVLALKPHGRMELGHVAAVSRVVDKRTILVTHSNWSLIDGRRGQIEKDVRVVDVSPGNDWSRVRIWYAPLGDLGTTEWPAHGFIYPDGKPPMRLPEGAAPALVSTAMPVQAEAPAQAQQRPVPRLAYADMLMVKVPAAPTAKKTAGRLDGLARQLEKAAAAELKGR